jgi:hypothetical protein
VANALDGHQPSTEFASSHLRRFLAALKTHIYCKLDRVVLDEMQQLSSAEAKKCTKYEKEKLRNAKLRNAKAKKW